MGKIQICSNKGAVPFWGQIRGKRGKFCKKFKNLLINHWPECIDIWYGASLGQGD